MLVAWRIPFTTIGQYSHSFFGIVLAYAINAVGFAVSAICLWLIRTGDRRQLSEKSPEEESIWTFILTGLKYVRSDEALLLIIQIMGGLNILFIGPIMVGIPVLADQRIGRLTAKSEGSEVWSRYNFYQAIWNCEG